ncbi:T9SS sorting signal type C domain-containing protein [Flavobacterium sp.]|uniref:T9SS sorting signal type C domain-containing protein n=1 Tax=Flavobacterium sp. TaxID=239 RepID=UPI003D0F69BF
MKKTLLLLLLLPFLGFSQAASGTYVINSGSAAPLNSLSNAIAYINANGISAPVTLLLDSDQVVTSQIVINSFSGSSATNTLTIKPNTGKTILISGGQLNTSTSIIKLNGADNVIIDGSNTTNGTSQNLTIKSNISSNYNNESIIWIGSASSANGANNNIIKNTLLSGNSTSNNAPVINGIVFASSADVNNQEDIANSDNLIQNNTFSKIRYAINVKGNSSTYSKNLTISDNTFGGSGNEILISAIRISNGQNYTISKNTIAGMVRTDNSFRLSGILLEGNSNTGVISKNIIKGIYGNGGGRATAIWVNLSTTNTGLTISNNFINDIKTSSTNPDDYDNSGSGIFIEGGKGINIYYNTVVLNSTQTGFSSALIAVNSATTLLNVRNNIFSNNSSGGTKYALFTNINKTDFTDINYNNYKTSGTYIAYYGAQITTLAQLQSATGKDSKSQTTTPAFISSNDFHLDAANTANNNLLVGTPITGITTDIDEDTRTKPYMGADELKICTPPTITTQPTALIACEGQDGTFSVATSTTGATYQWQYSADGSTGWTNTDGTQFVSDHTKATLVLTNIPLSYTGYFVRCIVSNSATCFTYSNTAKLTVNPKVVASVSITSSEASTTICDGTLVTFKATPVNGGTTPKYQWYIGTTLLTGQTGVQYTTNGLKDGDAIKVVMTSNATSACLTSSPATSNVIIVSIIKTDRGRTKGGIHICQGSANPTLGVYNFDDPNKDAPYSDPVKIIRWEYSDDNNVTWTPIVNTAGLITYKPTTVLTASRNYRAVAKNGTCNEQYAIETRIDIEFAPTINSQSTATQTQCIGGTFNPLTVSATGFGTLSYQWYSNTAKSTTGGTSLVSANGAQTNNYIPQATTAGTLYYYCIVTGTCGPTISAASEAIVTKAAPTAPRVGMITQPNCTKATGSVVLEDVPHSGRLLESRGTVYNFTTSGTTFEISGLAPGTYKFAIEDNCTVVYSADIVIKSTTNIWNGTSWSGGTPTATDPIEFTGTYNLDNDVVGCSCTVSNNANVTIQKGRTLTIINEVNVNSGTLTFENSASLVQINNVVNTGSISYKRITPAIFQKDYLYWSTPVNPQKLVDVSPSTTSTKYYGNDGTQWVQTNRESNMVIGKGYIIRGPANYSNTAKQEFTATFKGVPNNGDLEGEALVAGNYFLLGNPYPSALNADDLINKNKILNGTIYLWTHNTPAKPTPTQQYTVDDYAAYNLSGGVSAKSDPNHSGTSGVDNGTKPTGKIAAGQAFFVNALEAGKVKFTNSMRIGGANNSQFFKSGNTSKETAVEKNRIWLNMTNAEGVFKQVLVGYIEGATDEYDAKYDGISFDGNPYLDFYSVNNTNKYVIQGRALPFTNTDIVPLGYRTTVEGDFTISIDEVDGNMSNQAIYVEDKTSGVIHDLTTSNYTFKTVAGSFTDRLVLRYTNKTLGTGDFENVENGLLVSVKDKVINIQSSKENIKEITVFDVTGKMLYNKNKIGATELQIANLQSGNQVLFLKVTLENDFTASKKIIFN